MKLIEKKNFVKVSGGIEENSFRLEFNSKIASILSDGIYSDKILAVVRELSTNAYDSHVEAGNSDPFVVHLPTIYDNVFWIRDYGVGLTPEKVKQIYISYGASDKDDNNDMVGCLGLGSKTPFCYNSRSFTLESWVNGIHYVYNCFINTDGLPKCIKMSETSSNELQGVKITLPVAKHDINNFIIAADKVYRYFKNKPNLINGGHINIGSPKYTLSGSNWGLKDNGNCSLVMGSISYPIKPFVSKFLDNKFLKILNLPIDIYVKIGEVDIAVSREELSYSAVTTSRLSYILKKVYEELNDSLTSEIDKCKTFWEARVKFCLHSLLKPYIDYKDVKYRGQDLFAENLYGKIKIPDGLAVYKFNGNRKDVLRVIYVSEADFYYNDLKTGWLCRLKQACKYRTSYLVDKNDIDKFCNLIGISPSEIKPISSVKYTVERKSRQKTTSGMLLLYGRDRRRISSFWQNKDIDLETGGFYLEFNRFQAVNPYNGLTIEPYYIGDDMAYICQNTNCPTPDVFGIKTIAIKNFKNDKWNCIFSWMVKKIKKELDSLDVSAILAYSNLYTAYVNRSMLAKNLYLVKSEVKEILDFKELIKTIENNEVKVKYINRLLSMYERWRGEKYEYKKTEFPDLVKFFKYMQDKYEILNFYWIAKSEHTNNYVSLLNKGI